MSEIDGQHRQKDLHVRASAIPFRQSVDGERVPQVMKPWLTSTRVTASNSRKGAQAAEVCVYRRVAKPLMLLRLKKGLVVLIPSPWRGQVLAKKLHHIASHNRDPSLLGAAAALLPSAHPFRRETTIGYEV